MRETKTDAEYFECDSENKALQLRSALKGQTSKLIVRVSNKFSRGFDLKLGSAAHVIVICRDFNRVTEVTLD